MKFKEMVVIKEFRPEVIHILQAVQQTAPKDYEPTITSGNDSSHSKGSKHYTDDAFDIRVKDYPGFDLGQFEQTRKVIDDWVELMQVYYHNLFVN